MQRTKWTLSKMCSCCARITASWHRDVFPLRGGARRRTMPLSSTILKMASTVLSLLLKYVWSSRPKIPSLVLLGPYSQGTNAGKPDIRFPALQHNPERHKPHHEYCLWGNMTYADCVSENADSTCFNLSQITRSDCHEALPAQDTASCSLARMRIGHTHRCSLVLLPPGFIYYCLRQKLMHNEQALAVFCPSR